MMELASFLDFNIKALLLAGELIFRTWLLLGSKQTFPYLSALDGTKTYASATELTILLVWDNKWIQAQNAFGLSSRSQSGFCADTVRTMPVMILKIVVQPSYGRDINRDARACKKLRCSKKYCAVYKGFFKKISPLNVQVHLLTEHRKIKTLILKKIKFLSF